MRLHPVLTPLAALCSLALVLGGCSDDGGDDEGGGGTTTEAPAETDGPTTSAVEAEDAEVDCEAYGTVVQLFAGTEDIATGNAEQQAAADEALAEAIAALEPSAEGDEFVSEAVDVLGQVSFQVTDSAEGPSPDEIDSALVTLEDAWGDTCTEPEPGSQPTDPETGTTAPAEEGGTETTLAEDDGEAVEPETTVPECPAPEVLEAEGFSCDENGQLTPLDEETTTECPAPEVLEAEGYTCDENGTLTPIEGE